jgi:hypothetical protein
MHSIRLLAVALLATAASAAVAAEANLRYAFSAFQGPPVYTPGQKLNSSSSPTETLRHGPYVTSKKPLYLTATLGRGGDTTFTFVLDEAAGTGKGYNRLIVDANNNEDLTDDPPVPSFRRFGQTIFGPIPLRLTVDGRTRLYHARLETFDRGPNTGPSDYWLRSLGYYIGDAQFGVKRLPVALVDANANGLYGDAQRGFGREPGLAGDMVLVDANKDGRFEQGGIIPKESLWCGKCIVVDSRFYELNLRADGSALTVTPAAVKLASLRASYPRFGIVLVGDHGVFPIEAKHGVARVPPGEYKVLSWSLEQRAPSGKWSVQGSGMGAEGGMQVLKIGENEPSSFQLKAPLIAKVTPQKFTPGAIDFSLSLTTSSGESIQGVTVNGRQPEEPMLRVLDEGGNEVAKLKFHYG